MFNAKIILKDFVKDTVKSDIFVLITNVFKVNKAAAFKKDDKKYTLIIITLIKSLGT